MYFTSKTGLTGEQLKCAEMPKIYKTGDSSIWSWSNGVLGHINNPTFSHYSNSPFEIAIEGIYEIPSWKVIEPNLVLLAFSHLLQLGIQQGHYLVGRDGEGRPGV
jgi:hypothetical protein